MVLFIGLLLSNWTYRFQCIKAHNPNFRLINLSINKGFRCAKRTFGLSWWQHMEIWYILHFICTKYTDFFFHILPVALNCLPIFIRTNTFDSCIFFLVYGWMAIIDQTTLIFWFGLRFTFWRWWKRALAVSLNLTFNKTKQWNRIQAIVLILPSKYILYISLLFHMTL